MGTGFGFLVFLLFIVIVIVMSSIRIVPQAHAYVIERLGTYTGTWSVGMHLKMPIIDKVAKRVTLKEQVVDFAPQPVITKDNVTMRIDTVVFFQITDPKLFCYGVENPIMAIENLTATTLRNIIGDLELDQTLTSRETINTKMRATLDEATDPWGIKVNRVELKNIIPPAAIQDAMELISDTVSGALELIQGFWKDNGQEIRRFVTRAYIQVDHIIKTVVGGIAGFVESILSGIRTIWDQHGEAILKAAQAAWDGIWSVITTVSDFISGVVETALELIGEFWENHGEEIMEFAEVFAIARRSGGRSAGAGRLWRHD